MLVDYASSSDEDEPECSSSGLKRSEVFKDPSKAGALASDSKRRKAVPPLPDRFHDLFTSNPKMSENSPVHEGRTRVLPHVDGMWPTHVYLEWMPTAQEGAVLAEILEGVKNGIEKDTSANKEQQLLIPLKNGVKSLVRSNIGVRLPLHVSLSPTLMIPGDQKEQFKEMLTRCVEGERKYTMSPRLYFNTSKVFVVTNQIRSRAFIVLQLNDQGSNKVRFFC